MIRGLLIVLSSVLLFVSLLIAGISWDLSSSLQYKSIEGNAVSFIGQISGQQINITQQIESGMNMLKFYCATNQEYRATLQNYTFRLSCQSVNSGESASQLASEVITNFVSDAYNASYSCTYWDCFGKYPAPTFLISRQAEFYWRSIFYYSLIAVLGLSAALFFLVEKKRNFPFVIGWNVVLASLPILGISKLLPILNNKLISDAASLFFSQSTATFIRMILVSAALPRNGTDNETL
ncbi:MAG: hypothetical protein M1165_02515 [Candidatus Pacearchaeota archaeon]|nr:hypothetical protein [Candidatus Pacearchaeota archaeon]